MSYQTRPAARLSRLFPHGNVAALQAAFNCK
jgi:hypothetical protein